VYKPKQLAKCAAITDIVQQLCVLATGEEPPDHDADVDGPAPNKCAVEALDEVAICLPSKHVMPTLITFVDAAAASGTAVPLQRGALRVLGAAAEGCADSLRRSKHLGRLIQFVLANLAAEDARLRTSAAVALGHLACALLL
jgi:hypothetical protein